jgi:hypothetical protein
MVDLKKFWVYIHTTKVKKGYDWVELPDGRKINVSEGKYMKIFKVDDKDAFGFEDLTEEIGETPDYDFETPMCVILDEIGETDISVSLDCKFTGRYRVSLYYDGIKISEFWWGKLRDFPSFTYTKTAVAPFKQNIAYTSPDVGVSDTYLPRPIAIDLPSPNILTDIDVAFDGLDPNETQTVKLEFLFDDNTTGSVEISASGSEGLFVKKKVGAYEIYQAMGGSFGGETVSISKNIVAINIYAKTNLSTPIGIPYVLIRYYA